MESVEALPSPSSLTSLLALLGPVLFLHQTLLIDEEVEFSVGLRMRQSSTQKEEEEQGEEEGGGSSRSVDDFTLFFTPLLLCGELCPHKPPQIHPLQL